MRDAAVFDLPARLDHLEPPQVPHRLRGFRHRIPDRFFNAVRGGADEFDFFVDVIAHGKNHNKISGGPEGKSRAAEMP